MTRLILALSLTLMSACSSSVQTSSGAAFLAERGAVADAAVAQAAQGEPDLHFPAKIGIARVLGADMTNPPRAELGHLAGHRPDPDPLGQFVVVSPLVADTLRDGRHQTNTRTAQLTAARQHLDYVLVYVLTRDGRGFGAVGRGEAILMDVRSGYVYGTATVETSVAGFGTIRKGWGDHVLGDEAAAKVVAALAPEVAEMFNQLYARAQTS